MILEIAENRHITQIFSRGEWGIDFSVISEAIIADLKTKPHEDLKLVFQNKQIPNAALISLRCVNSGNVDLQPVDLNNPTDIRNPKFKVTFEKSVVILSTHVTPVGNDQSTVLSEQHSTHPNEVTFAVDLFNSKAEVTLDLIVANYTRGTTIHPAASGLGLRSRIVPPERRFKLVWWQIVLVIGWSLLVAFVFKTPVKRITIYLADNVPFIGISLVKLIDSTFESINMSPTNRNHQIISISAVLFIIIFLIVLVSTKILLDYIYISIL